MKDKILQPFVNIPTATMEDKPQGTNFINDLRELNVGQGGSNSYRVDKNGIWLGGKTLETAVFSVDMGGILTATGVKISGTITGGIIQTATTGLRVRMSSSPTNKIEFLSDNDVEGILEIIEDGDEFNLKLGGDGGGYIEITSSVGASQIVSFSAPFISAFGKASAGQATFVGSSNFPTAVGLEWSGSGVGTFSFNLGDNLAKVSSEITPETTNTHDLGKSAYRWKDIYLSGFAYLGSMTTSTASGKTPATGATYFDTTLGKLRVYNGSSWETVTSS